MIDFVILWVDGNDPQWRQTYNQYASQGQHLNVDASAARYRDWGCLKYWFRGVEQFAPWVRKVHLVTNGQIPEWLNTHCDKLHLVRHTDILPAESLPSFNACAIENSIHRIEGLAEHFVYWNDDFYLTAPVKESRFFVNDQPTDMAVGNVIQSDGIMGHITLNDLDCINHHFVKHEVMRDLKWWRWSYGSYLLRTLALYPWPRFTGLYDHHLPQAYLKSIWDEVWEKNEDILAATSNHRFRHVGDVNQWLFRYWQLAKGTFAPLNVMKDSQVFQLSDNNFDEAIACIRKRKKSIVVLNDGAIGDFEMKKRIMMDAFDSILPQPSKFEKK